MDDPFDLLLFKSNGTKTGEAAYAGIIGRARRVVNDDIGFQEVEWISK
jgi:hypothetical protein